VATFGLAPGTSVRDDDELFWYVTGLPSATFNSIMYANLAPDRIDWAVDEMRALRAEHGVPINWLIGPSSRPADLGEQLAGRGFRHLAELKALSMEVDAAPLPDSPGALKVEAVRDEAVYYEWIEAESRGFEMEGPLGDGFAALRRATGIGPPSLTHFLGRLDGRPVATASLLLEAGIAGIYDVSVEPAARNRGIGRAMTLHALAEARARGYRQAFLQPSAMGERMYRSIGFDDAFSVRIYG
jgi:GNAT superfamily N-acetyltransferase